MITCPHCNTEINPSVLPQNTTTQTISNIKGSGNNFNQGKTENGDIIYNVDKKSSEAEVQYTVNNEREINLNMLFLSGIPALLIGTWGFLGDTASIFSLFKTSDDIFSGLSSLFFGWIIIAGLALIFAASIGACCYLLGLYLGWEIKSPFSSDFFRRQPDGKTVAYTYQVDCQTGSCQGKLTVVKAEPNEEGETYVGCCNENPTQHIYSYDKSLKTGKPIKLTPKKTPPPSN